MDGERDDFSASVPLRSAFWATSRTALWPSAVLLAKSLNPITERVEWAQGKVLR